MMERLSTEQRTKVVQFYFESQHSIIQTQKYRVFLILNWPPRSPDLTAPDFFLWGYLKGKVNANMPRTIQEFKANI